MSSATFARPPSAVPIIVVSPCVQLDELGVWATARLIGAVKTELDLFVPATRSVRRVDVGHGANALGDLGRGAKRQILLALDGAFTRPLSLVLDPRVSKGKSSILSKDGSPRAPAVHALAAILGARSYDTAGHAVEFTIAAPQADRLALAATSVFGPNAATPFRPASGGQRVGGLLEAPPATQLAPVALRSPSGDRIVRYVRTASSRPEGRNTEEAQLQGIDRFLATQGVSTRRTIVDKGKSGLSADRRGIREILRLVDGGQVDAVAVASPCRLFRSASALRSFLARLKAQGVALLCADGSVMDAVLLEIEP